MRICTHLHGDGVEDVRGQELQHLQVAAEETQGPDAGVGRALVLLVAEGVHDVDHDGWRVCQGVGLPVRGHSHLVPVQSAVGAQGGFISSF